MQGHIPESPALSAQAAPATSGVQLAEVRPGVLRLDAPPHPIMLAASPFVTGHPLVVVNASGRTDGAEPTRQALALLGWSAPRSRMFDAPAAPRTTIRYAVVNSTSAKALARTLPSGAQLVACTSCVGLRLIVGTDAAGWTFQPPAAQPSHRG